jgi:cytochrome c556
MSLVTGEQPPLTETLGGTMKARTFTTLALAIAVSGTVATQLAAHGDEHEKRFAESQHRHDVMEHFGNGFGKIMKIRKGEAGTMADLPGIADDMAKAASMTVAAFEKDTRGMEGFTKAKDNIWENWDDFSQRLQKMDVDAQAFAVAAKTGDMAVIGPAMGALGKNCKSCHDDYKVD